MGTDGTRRSVVLLFGGMSSEHGISCVTAGGVLGAIDRDRYDVVPVGITRDGRWVQVPDDPALLAIRDGVVPEVDGSLPEVVLGGAPGARTLVRTDPGGHPPILVDVVFPLLHGAYGEDGTIQGLLELFGVRYVGSGVLSSAIAMDKHHMKVALAAAELPVCRHVFVPPGRWAADPAGVAADVAALGLPVFVKPARAGSSLGVVRVTRPEDLPAAMEQARAADPRVIVEEAVPGRELECGVLDGPDGPRVSPPGEIVLAGGRAFYDFEAKYLHDGAVTLDVPAQVDASLCARLQDLALRAFEALSCEGLARVDFFLRPDGEVLVNEVNTMPGFTPSSMFPRVWQAAGVDYPALVDRLLTAALTRPLGLR